MKINRICLTGPDDSVDPLALVGFQNAYPWVETLRDILHELG